VVITRTITPRKTRAKEIDRAAELRTKQGVFLTAVAELGTLTRTARAAGVHRSMHEDWMNGGGYAKAFADATKRFGIRCARRCIGAQSRARSSPVV